MDRRLERPGGDPVTEPDRSALPRWPNWLGLVVDDLERQRRFYGEVLGLDEVDAAEDWVQFDLGGPNIFEILRRAADPQYDRPRFQPGFAVDDVHGARERLIALGAEPITDLEGGPESGGAWCYFRDPEGNVFEVSQRIEPPSGREEAP
jgi:catechol 2,3-dioxygenase-like lactoylglutathione lyase family enzyme